MIPNRELIPEQVVVGYEEHEQGDTSDFDSRAVDFRDPRNHEAAADGRDGAQCEPGYHHPGGEIEGRFGLMVVRP